MPKKGYLFLNDDGVITCTTSGSPSPVVHWTRINGSINTRWSIESQHIYAKRASKIDEGYYSCSSSNKYGSTNSIIQIKVLNPTTFIKKPINLQLTRGQIGYFICMPLCDGSVKYDIVWTKNDKPIPGSSNVFTEPRSLLTANNKLIINKAASSNSGTYSCNVRLLDDDGFVINVKKQQFDLIVHGLPNAPSKIETSVISCDVDNIKYYLTWNNEINPLNPAKYHLIEIGSETVQSKIVWELLMNTTESSAILSHFPSPCGYKVRMLACNDHGCSLPTDFVALEGCTCVPIVPSKNPTDVYCSAMHLNQIIITFDDIPHYHKIGENFEYVLFLQTDNIDSNKYTYVNYTISPSNRTFVIENSDKPVVFYVRSRNVQGLSNQINADDVHSCYPGFDAPNIQINDFRIKTIAKYHFELSWTCLAVTVPKKTFYLIELIMLPFYSSNKIPFYRNISVPLTKCSFDLIDIPKGYRINATISVASNVNFGPSSNIIQFTTDGDLPTVPRNVEARPYGKTMYVSWLEPENPNGVILEYNIHLNVLNSDSVQRILTVKHPNLHVFINDLPSLEYVQVKITAINMFGSSQAVIVNSTTSLDDTPGIPEAPIVTIGRNGNVSVVFQIGRFGGMPDSFKVFAEASKIDISVVEVRYPENNIAFLSLFPGKYQIYTVAKYKNLSSSESPYYSLNLLRWEIELDEEISNISWFKSSGFIVSAVVCTIAVLVMLIATLIFRKNQNRRHHILAELEKRAEEELLNLTYTRV